jgi:putative ABC transport system substrate-binding protein
LTLISGLARIKAFRPDAFITVRELVTVHNAQRIADYALKNNLPSMFEAAEFVRAGGLISYGINHAANWPRAVVFVDRILKGANPATLPVEPPQLELVINLKTAEKIGVKIPPEILLEANEVIK